MNRLILLPLLLTSCATASEGTAPARRAELVQAAEAASSTAPARVPPPPQVRARPEEPAEGGLSQHELSIWNSPRFQERFIESYLAETEVEPPVTLREREDLIEILDLIAADNLLEATDVILDDLDEISSAVFDYTLGNIYLQREEFDAAASAFETAIEKFPKFLRAHKNLGRVRRSQSRFEEAAESLARVLELGGNDVLTYGQLGFTHLQLQNYLPAESALRYAALLDPETIEWKMGLAEALFRQGRHNETASLCAQLIAEDPEFITPWLLQANAYLALEQPLKAAENYELVERLGGSTVDSLTLLGDIYINEQLFDIATEAYVRAMEEDESDRPERSIRAATILVQRNAYDEARRLIATIEETYDLGVEDRKGVLKLRSKIALAAGAGDEEARVLEEVVELDPLDGDALILLGQHARRTGDNQKAAFLFERAANIEAFEAEAKKNHGQLLVSQGRYPEAVPLIRRANDLEPTEGLRKYLEQIERLAQSR